MRKLTIAASSETRPHAIRIRLPGPQCYQQQPAQDELKAIVSQDGRPEPPSMRVDKASEGVLAAPPETAQQEDASTSTDAVSVRVVKAPPNPIEAISQQIKAAIAARLKAAKMPPAMIEQNEAGIPAFESISDSETVTLSIFA